MVSHIVHYYVNIVTFFHLFYESVHPSRTGGGTGGILAVLSFSCKKTRPGRLWDAESHPCRERRRKSRRKGKEDNEKEKVKGKKKKIGKKIKGGRRKGKKKKRKERKVEENKVKK